METLSWLNMAVAAVVLAAAGLFALPAWSFWTALLVGGIVLGLEMFDEWAETRGLAAEVVGPESVVLVAALWLVGTVLVVGGPPAFVTIGVVGGLLLVVTSSMNLIASARMDDTDRLGE
jgi:hypothetical protein